MTKSERHAAIMRLISTERINTQEGILKGLRAAGVSVTQATVSRDIKEMGLSKVGSSSGAYYVLEPSRADAGGRNRLMLTQSVISAIAAGHICCVKCHSGAAGVAAAAIDADRPNGVVGTIAGDDTIFILCEDEGRAASLAGEFMKGK